MAFYLNFTELPSYLEKDSVTRATVQELLKDFESYYKAHGEIADGCLNALDSIFGDTLEKALELVDTGSVKYLHTTSESIGIFQVEGKFHNNYTIFPLINYCPCLAYKFHVAGGYSFTCKHVLAAVIAKILGKAESIVISQSQLYNLVLSSACINESVIKN